MHSQVVELNDRNISFNGTSILLNDESVEKMILSGFKPTEFRVGFESEEVKKFNMLIDDSHKILSADSVSDIQFDTAWEIPNEFQEMDIDTYIENIVKTVPKKDREIAEIRLQNELNEFKRRDLIPFLKTIIYIVDTFRKKQICWGVGRGSSCASFLLFKLGVHLVDPIKYKIPMSEFFHD